MGTEPSIDIDLPILRRAWTILTRSERRQLLTLFALMVCGMTLETLGAGLIYPTLQLLTGGELKTTLPSLTSHVSSLPRTRLVAMGMLILVAVYLVKNVFLAFLAWRQTRFAFDLDVALSQRLFALYLSQPYTFHLQRNSANLVNGISGETAVFTNTVVSPALTVGTEILVLIGLGTLLFSIEPTGAFGAVVILGLGGWGFHAVTRHFTDRWASARLQHEELSLQHLQQGLGAVKEVLLLGRESEFLARYLWHNEKRARAGQHHVALQQMPKLALELLAIMALAALTLSLLATHRPMVTIFPTLGLFAAVAFRVMPSVNRILNSTQQVRYGLPAVSRLHDDLFRLTAAALPRPAGAPAFADAVVLHGVTYAYTTDAGPAVRDVTLRIERGEVVGIIGPSGAGKSTLVDLLLGLLTPTSGEVLVDGHDLSDGARAWQDQIGYVPQVIYLTDDTLRRNVAFGLRDELIDEAATWEALRAAQLEDFVRRLPHGLDTVVGERGVRISGGERQRVGIARALYHNPAVIVLDEATSSLDTETESGVLSVVRDLKRRKTIIIVSHRRSTIAHCDRVYLVRDGRLADERTPTVA